MMVAIRRVRSSLAIAAALVSLSTSACTDLPTEPSARLSPTAADRIVGGCEAQVIEDPDAPCSGGGGGGLPEQTYMSEVQAESGTLTVSSSSGNAAGSVCPVTYVGSGFGSVRSRKTGRIYDFGSSGVWTLDAMRSAIYLPSSQAIYRWPPGFWAAFDQQTGDYALIKIGSARASCAAGRPVDFFSFYDVVIEGDEPRTPVKPADNGGGDSAVDPASCHPEYVFLERNDGAGWYVWWEGYATVCQ